MKNRVYFFTGTGNSLKVARTISEVLPNCELMAIYKDTQLEIPMGYDRVGFIFPNYAGGPPKIVVDFIRNLKLPEQGDTYLFVVATYGGNVGSVLGQVETIIKQKNWELNYGATVWSHPNLVTAYPMIGGVRFFTKMSNRKSKRLANEIAGKKQNSIPEIKRYSQKMYEGYIGQIYESDRDYHVNDNCISCGVCSKICPARNITINDEKPEFHHQCESCMACIQYCPKRAINYKDKTQKRGRYTHPDVDCQTIIQYYR